VRNTATSQRWLAAGTLTRAAVRAKFESRLSFALHRLIGAVFIETPHERQPKPDENTTNCCLYTDGRFAYETRLKQGFARFA